MKQLTRKLFLSIFTLAVCAVTLVSTTFAWYTTNTETKANNLTAGTAESGAASILVSLDHKYWYSSVELAQYKASDLKPLYLSNSDGASDTDTVNDLVDLDNAAGISGQHYIEFKLYFKTLKTDKDVKLGIKDIHIYNNADSLTAYELDNLLYNQNATVEIKEGDTVKETITAIDNTAPKYSKDVVDSLAMTVESDTVNTLTGNIAYHLNKFKDKTLNPLGSAHNAHVYYDLVMKDKTISELYRTDNTVEFNADYIAVLDKEGEDYATVTFRFYLNGSDIDCFDSCKGQAFTINFEFEIAGYVEDNQ